MGRELGDLHDIAHSRRSTARRNRQANTIPHGEVDADRRMGFDLPSPARNGDAILVLRGFSRIDRRQVLCGLMAKDARQTLDHIRGGDITASAIDDNDGSSSDWRGQIRVRG